MADRLRRRWARLVCRVRGHREVATTMSWQQYTAATGWVAKVQPGPSSCGRCLALLGSARVEVAEDCFVDLVAVRPHSA